ncbi:hypothetical protein Pmani_025370 [Petrolisthes manimaculis]|uniref:Uncharacterized protein n=1 Tax=Petrolisthes manimaculis TaxID=1843537 RepID=A0AAE1P5M5_9EUCA|nr:hypothetical protein Pmani_025370 [Petrolisthes manimaculis]
MRVKDYCMQRKCYDVVVEGRNVEGIEARIEERESNLGVRFRERCLFDEEGGVNEKLGQGDERKKKKKKGKRRKEKEEERKKKKKKGKRRRRKEEEEEERKKKKKKGRRRRRKRR